MKKLLTTLALASTVVIAPVMAVSCGGATLNSIKNSNGEMVKPILVTDGGTVKDGSFNMLGLKGLQDYAKDNGQEGKLDGNYIESSSSDVTGLKKSYQFVHAQKASVAVLNGFIHGSTFVSDSNGLSSLGNTPVIWVDGYMSMANSGDTADKEKLRTIRFDSEIAGFQAGYETVKYLTDGVIVTDGKVDISNAGNDAAKKVWNNTVLSIGGFMGQSSKYGVDNYIWGMLVGVDTFIQQHTKDGDSLKGVVEKIKLANTDQEFAGNDTSFLGADESTGLLRANIDWYTQSFEQGGGNVTTTLQKLKKNNANVIFPVAGPQVNDALSQTNAYIIGVDTNQVSEVQTQYKNRFLTSATKKINEAVTSELEYVLDGKTPDGLDTTTFEGLDVNKNWSGMEYANGNLIKDKTAEIQNGTEKGTAILDLLVKSYKEIDDDSTSKYASYFTSSNISKIAKTISEKLAA